MSTPLTGVRVVEFGNLVAAPYCGMLLADLGADVIKIEPPEGDLARQIGPFTNGESGLFMGVNRGKRSVTLDPKHPDARLLLWELAGSADVVIHNLRRGAMERMGLGYEELTATAPGLIYAVISAFGSDGPYAERAGIDLIFQGESGMMSMAGGPDDPPQKTATTIGDFVAGTNAALLVCATLVERGASGRGRLVETSLRDGLIAVQGGWNALFFADGRQPPRTGTASPVTAPNQTFPTADGRINLAIVSDRHFALACRLLGLGHLALDDRFSSNETRVGHRQELADEFERVLAAQDTDHWMELLGGEGLPVGRLLTLPEVFSDPQVIHNEMLVEFDHPVAGPVMSQGSPLRSDGETVISPKPAPSLGQHTSAVLTELGVSRQRLRLLQEEGAVFLG